MCLTVKLLISQPAKQMSQTKEMFNCSSVKLFKKYEIDSPSVKKMLNKNFNLKTRKIGASIFRKVGKNG